MSTHDTPHKTPLQLGGMLLALGIVYGDIGTSPLYVVRALLARFNPGGDFGAFILGALSLVFWTLTLITTFKYVLLALRADNHGEGGIFALYTIVRQRHRWLLYPALIGGATLLADGVLTPAVTVTSAIEGLQGVTAIAPFLGENGARIPWIALCIIVTLFMVQRFGTGVIGRTFGPVMLLWFLFLGSTGLWRLIESPIVLKALNPLYGLALLTSPNNSAGILILGAVFLATTGAEALYSDIGHVGRANIYGSWPFVKLALLLNYFGQGSWLLQMSEQGQLASLSGENPFFAMLPENMRLFAVILSTLAAIIASQSLITGSFTLVAEAINLKLMPHMRISYPSDKKGQMYISLVNHVLCALCILVVLYFRTSEHMEAAYGLAITITMLMTTVLLGQYLALKKIPRLVQIAVLGFFFLLEGVFFIASAAKFIHGGFIAILLALALATIMIVWHHGSAIEKRHRILQPICEYLPMLRTLRGDDDEPRFATNVVYLTEDITSASIDQAVLYSIFDKRPKRADAYWFVTIHVTDEPYTHRYAVNTHRSDICYSVQLYLGYKVHQQVNVFLRQITADLLNSGEIQPQRVYSIYPDREIGDFAFVMLRRALTPDAELSFLDHLVMQTKYTLKRYCGSPAHWFGLSSANVRLETVPLFVRMRPAVRLERIDPHA